MQMETPAESGFLGQNERHCLSPNMFCIPSAVVVQFLSPAQSEQYQHYASGRAGGNWAEDIDANGKKVAKEIDIPRTGFLSIESNHKRRSHMERLTFWSHNVECALDSFLFFVCS